MTTDLIERLRASRFEPDPVDPSVRFLARPSPLEIEAADNLAAAAERERVLVEFARDVDAASLSGTDTVSLLVELCRLGKAARAALDAIQTN